MRKWAALLLAPLVLFCAACAGPEEPETEDGYLLYFLSPEDAAAGGDAIVGLRLALDVPETATVEEEAAAVIGGLIAGTEGGETALQDISLRDVSIIGRRAYVDFSTNYAALTGISLSLANYCVTLSLTQLEGISAVTITAGGRDLFYQEAGVLMGRDVLLSTMEDVIDTVPVTLYFQDSQGTLQPEQRLLELYEGQTLAESLLSALEEGPQDRELSPVLPEGFVFNGARVEDRVCFLSVSGKALELLPESVEEQAKILRSIADSIYSMDTVDEISVFADGEEVQQFGLAPMDPVRFRPDEPPAE